MIGSDGSSFVSGWLCLCKVLHSTVLFCFFLFVFFSSTGLRKLHFCKHRPAHNLLQKYSRGIQPSYLECRQVRGCVVTSGCASRADFHGCFNLRLKIDKITLSIWQCIVCNPLNCIFKRQKSITTLTILNQILRFWQTDQFWSRFTFWNVSEC